MKPEKVPWGMAKKRTKADKKKANRRRVQHRVVVETSGGEFSLGGLDSDGIVSKKKSSIKIKSAVTKSRSKIMSGLDVPQINKDLKKTLLVATVVLAVLLVILNYF